MKKYGNDVPALSKEQKSNAAAKLEEYMSKNFDIEIGGLQAGFLVDFITENIGAYFYNNAVADSMTFITGKTEELYLLMKDER